MRAAISCLLFVAQGCCVGLPAQEPSVDSRAPVTIQVDAAAPGEPVRPTWNYFGADEPNYSYAPHGQQLLGELSILTQTPVYVRLHNLLTSGDGTASLKWGSTNVYTESPTGLPIYDWTVTDRIFDAMVHHGVHPLVEVGFMPEALSTHPQPYRHTFPKGDIYTGWTYPPKSYEKWQALVAAWTHHLLERYGSNEVNTWLWEVWNEPDIGYWHGTPEEFDKLYDYTAAGIQSVLPSAKIGGPEATGISARSEVFLRQFLDHCDHGKNAATGEIGAPLAFISFHPKGSPKFIGDHIEMGIRNQLQSAQRGFQVVASYPRWKNTPIILGESDPEGCAACGGPQNGYRNGTLYGVSIVEATQRIGELARQNGVILQGAVNWAFEFEDQPAFAGFRDLATDGIDKPVLNALRLMGYLAGPGARQLPVTSDGVLPLASVVAEGVRGRDDIDASASARPRQVDVLVWNYHDDDVNDRPAQVVLRVNGLAQAAHGHVKAVRYLVDRENANSYTAC
jgi:xylan 1,4-beta-xylosidase